MYLQVLQVKARELLKKYSVQKETAKKCLLGTDYLN